MQQTTILRGIVGSTAYGLATENSDVDQLGVFVANKYDILGLDWHSDKESRVKQGPTGDDIAEHEVRKFIKLALKANPTIIELLWLPENLYTEITFEGLMLRAVRNELLSSKYVYNSYYGYATAQYKKLLSKDKPKYARHIVRLLEQGTGLLRTGMLNVEVSDPQRYWDFDKLDVDGRHEVVTEALRNFPAEDESFALPDKPDYESARHVLDTIRRNMD